MELPERSVAERDPAERDPGEHGPAEHGPAERPVPERNSRLDLLKALGDNTRYAIYLELARSARPLSTSEVAASLQLHLNTVRPHLERMREVGLLESRPDNSGGVGRPQKLYELAADAPGLGLEPPVYPMLARMLLDVAVSNETDPETVLEAGRDTGRSLAHRMDHDVGDASRRPGDPSSPDAPDGAAMTMQMLDDLGFDPAWVVDGSCTSVGFGHCPFGDLAKAHPQVVCALHLGMMEGFTEELGDSKVENFCDLSSRTPCRADVVARA